MYPADGGNISLKYRDSSVRLYAVITWKITYKKMHIHMSHSFTFFFSSVHDFGYFIYCYSDVRLEVFIKILTL